MLFLQYIYECKIMIGYGIPRTETPSWSGTTTCTWYEWDKGYLYNTEMWYGLTGDDPSWRTASDDDDDWNIWDDWRREDVDRFLKLQDVYLYVRARQIQRWVRSFKDLPPCCPCPE